MLFNYLKSLIIVILILFVVASAKKQQEKKIQIKPKTAPAVRHGRILTAKDSLPYMSCVLDNDTIHISKFVSLGKKLSISVSLIQKEKNIFITKKYFKDSLVFNFDKKYLVDKKSKFKAEVYSFDSLGNVFCLKTIQVTHKDYYEQGNY